MTGTGCPFGLRNMFQNLREGVVAHGCKCTKGLGIVRLNLVNFLRISPQILKYQSLDMCAEQEEAGRPGRDVASSPSPPKSPPVRPQASFS